MVNTNRQKAFFRRQLKILSTPD